MLGGGLTGPPGKSSIGDDKMSSNRSKAQTRISVGDSNPIVIDTEGAVDEVYSVLANERCRQVLSALVREPMPINTKTLARQVTIQEACDNSKMVTEERIEQVHVSLYHHHLPKLADFDLITYDPETKTVKDVADTIDSIHL